MDLQIELLGRPQVERGGLVAKPRGRKTWALFAFLALSGTPPARQVLAELLFPDADDPFGALRWTLSDLRRLLGDQATIEGDPVRLVLPANSTIDIQILTRGTWVEAVRLPGLGRDLIEGQDIPASPSFELWLASERRHLGVVVESVLREAAMSSLARNEPAIASDYASRLVTLNPYDENHHVLLIRTLSLLGDRDGAVRHVEYATALFRRELGVDPTAALRMAATPTPVGEGKGEAAPAVLARVEAGEAAVAAGALEAGLTALRQAVEGARRLGDRHLLARSLVALGSTLVHAARGTDEEGAAALFEAGGLAEELGDRSIAATARRELAWIDFLRAHHDRAHRFLDEASVLAGDDEAEQAWVEMIRGACYTDTAAYASALLPLGSAVERARRAGTLRPAALAEAHIGRWHLLRGELDEARAALHRALQAAREGGWTTYIPWPESLLADVDLRAGDVDAAAAGFEHAFALGCQIGDPCWESIAARGLGLVAAARGNGAAALEWLEDAVRRCRRLPDSWLWVDAYALEALCRVAVDHSAPSSSRWIAELEILAAKAGLRELLARATMHRARLGDPGAAQAAAFLAAGIDNPALIAELAALHHLIVIETPLSHAHSHAPPSSCPRPNRHLREEQLMTKVSSAVASMVEEPTIKDQAGKVLGHIAGYVASRTVELGLAHGLIASLASHPDGLTAEALASDRDLDPFYVEVWCRSAFANELLERVTDKGYRLAPHMDTVLLDRGSPAYVAGTISVMSQPDVFDQFSRTLPTGQRTWWNHCTPGFIDGVSGTGGAFYARLIPGGLSQVPELGERLQDDARVLDTACGSGAGLVRLMEAYPSATVVGADGDAYSLELAAERLGRHGLTDRVELVHTPLEELDRASEFDLIINNISMHECRDINRVTDNFWRALRPGGYFVISDFPFPDTDEALRTVPGRVMSGIQFFEAQIDDQLLPVTAYLELLRGRGFRDVASFQLTPVHAVTYGVKDFG